MKVIITVAGKGTRVRPHSYSRPKPMIRIGTSPAISFIIKHLQTLNPECFIIVHDKWNGEHFKAYFKKHYSGLNVHFVLQEEQLGPTHAYLMARHYLQKGDDVLINNCDTLFIKDLSCLKNLKGYDGVIFVKEVKDYQRFGVILHKDHIMTGAVEKPEHSKIRTVNIGSYYFPDAMKVMSYIEAQVSKGNTVKGEYFISDLMDMMVKDGCKLWVEEVDDWLDVGKIETILESNAKLLKDSIWKGDNVKDTNCEFGKNVSIGHNTVLKNCKVDNSIIGDDCILEGITIKDSVIGNKVQIKKDGAVYNIGDNSTIT
jgi:glucose-1-phosphate thymidylyltransferase